MSLLKSVYNRYLVPGFLVNSLPKAGTNLLAKAVRLFPGIRPGGIHVGNSTLALFAQSSDLQGIKVPIGVDWPQPVSITLLSDSLQRQGHGRCATGHIPWAEELASLLGNIGMKTILILRDPRDVVVSHANYVSRTPTHFLFKLYERLSEPERIMVSIIGIEQTGPDDPTLLSIQERCRSVLPWTLESFNYATYFERLVGPQGGGSRDAQIQELQNIASHLGIKHNWRDLGRIAEQLFGGTSTFHKGVIGNWRNHFTPEHRRVFKELAGEIVVELGYERDPDW